MHSVVGAQGEPHCIVSVLKPGGGGQYGMQRRTLDRRCRRVSDGPMLVSCSACEVVLRRRVR